MNTKNLTLILSSLALVASLASCGGGGGASTSASSSTTATSTGTTSTSTSTTSTSSSSSATTALATPSYASASSQLAMFNQINTWRTGCGFPAYQDNAILDQTAQAHTLYLADNNTVTDTEVAGNPGYTGATYQDEAVALGWPSSVWIGGGSTSKVFTTASNTSSATFGIAMASSWAAGVYHQIMVAFPSPMIGLGVSQSLVSGGAGYPNYWTMDFGTMVFGSITSAITGTASPLTFPCQGSTAVPYAGQNELPTPPSVVGSISGTAAWGTPITVEGNASDTVVLNTATITASGSTSSVAVNILNASSDPNNEIGTYQAVAYPTSPLQANTTYNVSLSGTVNGRAFSRSFSFTTGSITG